MNLLVSLNKEVFSFWLNNQLVGAYIFNNEYITDLVIKPDYQNKEYGKQLLGHCISYMRTQRSVKNIRLRVAKSNTRAKRFYEKYGFKEIAFFSEHSF